MRSRVDAVTREMTARPEFELLKVSDSELLLTVQHAEQQLAGLLAIAATLGTVREVAIRQPSLESLFIKLTDESSEKRLARSQKPEERCQLL